MTAANCSKARDVAPKTCTSEASQAVGVGDQGLKAVPAGRFGGTPGSTLSDYSLGLGAAGLVLSLLMLGFFTRVPALHAYLVSFLVATLLGCSSAYRSRLGGQADGERG